MASPKASASTRAQGQPGATRGTEQKGPSGRAAQWCLPPSVKKQANKKWAAAAPGLSPWGSSFPGLGPSLPLGVALVPTCPAQLQHPLVAPVLGCLLRDPVESAPTRNPAALSTAGHACGRCADSLGRLSLVLTEAQGDTAARPQDRRHPPGARQPAAVQRAKPEGYLGVGARKAAQWAEHAEAQGSSPALTRARGGGCRPSGGAALWR